MENLTQLEASVSELSGNDYAQFRQWFWQHENERWDEQLEKDINENKLDSFATQALKDFKQGKFKPL
jgi:hypothetical protein